MLVAAAGLTAGVLLGQTLGRESPASQPVFATAEQSSPRMAPVAHYHSRMASGHPLADMVSLTVYETAANRDTERMAGGMNSAP